MVCAPVMVSKFLPREKETVLWVRSSRWPAILLLGLRRLLAKPWDLHENGLIHLKLPILGLGLNIERVVARLYRLVRLSLKDHRLLLAPGH